MELEKPQTYEECYPRINEVIIKFKKRWQLKALNWLDFDDVAQIVRTHIFKKWDMWDQSRPLEPWVSRVTSHQIKNIIQNNYTNYVSPCVKCPHNLGEGVCGLTKSGIQDISCDLVFHWSKRKKNGLAIKLPLPIENHSQEVETKMDESISFEDSIFRLDAILKNDLSENHFRVYKMLFFEDKSEDEVAKFMGYRTSEKNRKAGYKQIKNLRKMIKSKIESIIRDNDIII